MTTVKPPSKVLPFERPRHFPGDLDRLRAMLDDEDSCFEDSDLDDGLACAEAAIVRGVPGGHEVRADLLNMRAHRILAAGVPDAALDAWAAILLLQPTYLKAYVQRARVFGERDDHEAALAELDRFVTLAPTDAQGYLHRADFYETHGDSERALANLRSVVRLDPTVYEAHLSMAKLLAAKGDVQGASRAFAKHAEEVLGDVDSYSMRAVVLYLYGQEELALKDYEACVALAPNDPEALSWRGLLRMRQGQLDPAIADFTRLIALTPSEARGYWRRGEALQRVDRHAEALHDLARAIALGGDERGAAHAAQGKAQEARGDIPAALASYDIAIERNPSNAACLLRRFEIHKAAENWAACQIDAEALLVMAPDNTSILHTHARLCVKNDRRDEAMAAYDRLIALDAGNAHAYFERSQRLHGKGDTMAAYADVDRAYELAPEDPDIRAAYGRKQSGFAKTDEERSAAKELIVSSIKPDTEDPEAFALVAYHLYCAGYRDETVPYISRAIELDPENADYFDRRATYIRSAAPARWIDPDGYRASVEAALADADRSVALADDDDFDRYRQRADLRAEAGDLAGAIADYTRMLDVDPDCIDACVGRAPPLKRMGDMPGALADAARVTAREDAVIAEWAALGKELNNLMRFKLDDG